MDFSEQLHELSSHLNIIMRQAASTHGLTFAQAQFLLQMPTQGIAISELAKHLGIDISTMSRNVNKLEALGLISRKRSTHDSRAFNLFLSPAGDDLVDLLFAEIDTCTTAVLAKIPEELQHQAGDLLEQLNWALLQYHEN